MPKVAGFNIQVLLLVVMTEHTDKNRQSFERRVKYSTALPLQD